MKRLTITFLSAFCMLCILNSCKKYIETTDNTVSNNNSYSKAIHGDTIIHKLSVNGNSSTILEIKGEFYISDDMLIPKEQFEVLKKEALSSTSPRSVVIDPNAGSPSGIWPDGIVYFTYPVLDQADTVTHNGKKASALTELERDKFNLKLDTALANIAAATGIKFQVKSDNDTRYLKFQKSLGNDAYLGYWTSETAHRVNIANMEVNTIMHETLHALGIKHEHQRFDRDDYIIVDISTLLKDTKIICGR